MGTFRQKVTISNLGDPSKLIELEMVIDSGATYTWVPQELLSEIGIAPLAKRKLKLANGEIVERNIGFINIAIKEEVLPTLCIFVDPESEPLLGAHTLDGFSLGVDPVNKTLVPIISMALCHW